jgi:ribosomal protein S12 methylthiotransferase accessory factor
MPALELQGDGVARAALTALAAGRAELGGAEPDAIVLCADGFDRDAVLAAQAQAARRGLALVCARVEGALAFAGPWVQPGVPGCAVCAEVRRRAVVGGDNAGTVARAAGRPPAPLLSLLAEIVLAAAAAADGADGALPPRQVHVVRGTDLAGRRHAFLPVPGCPGCGMLDEDAADVTAGDLQPRPSDDPVSLRTPNSALSLEALRTSLVDWRLGLVPHMFRVDDAPLALTGTQLASPGGGRRDGGFGRAVDHAHAAFVALLESLEREAGMYPQRTRTAVVGTARDLAADAIDPARLGLHDPAAIAHPEFDLATYTPDLRMRWVWGFSLGERRPVLVPEQVVYYRLDQRPATIAEPAGHDLPQRCLFESSNGCAIGGSYEEAALHGLLEVIERDAFLMAWYARTPLRALDPTCDRVIALLADQLDLLGFDLQVHDTTTDLGVPSVWTVAFARDPSGAATLSTAGADPNPVAAVHGALIELVVMAALNSDRLERTDEELAALRAEPARIKTLEDHVAAYVLPAAREQFAFLGDGTGAIAPAEAHPGWRERWVRDDVTDTLRVMVDEVHAAGLDVVLVDQTPAHQLPLGLRTVKVLVPGALPMTFGHLHRRVEGLDRLARVPVESGRLASAPDLHDLPPHPFP